MTDAVPITANATFCATLVDEWMRRGLTHAFIAPGSRSTPLALALSAQPGLSIEIFHDERSASFAALGHGLASGTPAVVLCSSGTAGAHFFAAVIEADLSAVPMLVCTADRPPELWDRGAPQVINQTNMFGDTVRAFLQPGPPDDGQPRDWRPLAIEAFDAASGSRPGPVHLNLSFRDPLTGRPGDLPPAADVEATHPTPASTLGELADIVELVAASTTGVIVAGRGQSSPAEVHELADRLGWPVLADHRSGARSGDAIQHFDALLRSSTFADAQRPQLILRLGEIVASKSTSQWITAAASAGSVVVATRPWGRHIDPEDVASHSIDEAGFLTELLDHIEPRGDGHDGGRDGWREVDAAAKAAIDATLATHPLSEPSIARRTLASVPTGGALVMASSMPVRDVEWFGESRDDISVLSNRGANGIDGTMATAIGVATTGTPTVCLVGDVAFLHDASSLVALSGRTVDLTIVVTDNDGGGIFSFLPQHSLLERERYEQLFGTPHGTDLGALALAHGLAFAEWTEDAPADLTPSGVKVVRVGSDRANNLALHDALVAAVASRL